MEPKQCPFCGDNAFVRQIDCKVSETDAHFIYRVECISCWAKTEWCSSGDKAVEQWNRRV